MHDIDILCHKNHNTAVLLKKFAGEGERVDVQKLFGCVGLFTLVVLWCLGKIKLLVRLSNPSHFCRIRGPLILKIGYACYHIFFIC